jgi:enolase
MAARIKALKAREILDSRGNPTVETTIWSDAGHATIASIPSGASRGKFEALELRDEDPNRYNGMGVLKAIENVNKIIAPKIIGMDPLYQTKLDQVLLELDGTKNKSKLGANAILSVSQAVCELGAMVAGVPLYRYIAAKYGMVQLNPSNLPTPSFNLINGGKHGAGNKLDFQEFHLFPSSRQSLTEALRTGEAVYQSLKASLKKRNAVYAVGDEGGFAPNLYSNTDALELMLEALNNTQLTVGRDAFLGLDSAADSFFDQGRYSIKDKPQPLTPEEMIQFYLDLKKQYQLFSLEDPLQEEDWDNWVKITAAIGEDTMIVGDDVLVTNKERLLKALELKACNSILVKPNQIGTISETVEVCQIAQKNKFSVIVSHRSGETNDDFIADFAVGVGADYTKFGAPARGERLAKYNRLTAIEAELLQQ